MPHESLKIFLWEALVQSFRKDLSVTDLSSALEDGCPGPPHPLSADNIPGDVHLSIHKASLLQGYVIIQICFDGWTFLGHNFGFDGSDLLHRHGLRQGSGGSGGKSWLFERLFLKTFGFVVHFKFLIRIYYFIMRWYVKL